MSPDSPLETDAQSKSGQLDRRRPGRRELENAYLISMLRGEPVEFDLSERKDKRYIPGAYILAGVIGFWAAVVIIYYFL